MPLTTIIGIIDDDPAVRAALGSLVRSLGYEVACFACAEDFLAADTPVSCVVSDLHMPGLSGLDLQALLAGRPGGVPLILVTGRRDRGLHRRVRDAGVRWLLAKPCTADDLSACLREALDR
ncbi:response regulator transcription factor [Azospirillum sp. ST 5-10]|uniref:response regulator transcription factor n=1 Tax=unclassified Azospirillum TaxID=2630922 RepID=UPI003F4A6940